MAVAMEAATPSRGTWYLRKDGQQEDLPQPHSKTLSRDLRGRRRRALAALIQATLEQALYREKPSWLSMLRRSGQGGSSLSTDAGTAMGGRMCVGRSVFAVRHRTPSRSASSYSFSDAAPRILSLAIGSIASNNGAAIASEPHVIITYLRRKRCMLFDGSMG